MRRKLSLPIKAYSINSLHYNDKRHGYTQDAKNWIDTVAYLLGNAQNSKIINELRKAFDPIKNAYAVQIKCYIPKEIYYTKDGKLSRRSFDVTNFEKPLVDILFLEKFKVGLLVDDCVLKSCFSVKLPSPDGQWKIDITIKIVSN
jgi:wobble nucleotide-excising tRNase